MIINYKYHVVGFCPYCPPLSFQVFFFFLILTGYWCFLILRMPLKPSFRSSWHLAAVILCGETPLFLVSYIVVNRNCFEDSSLLLHLWDFRVILSLFCLFTHCLQHMSVWQHSLWIFAALKHWMYWEEWGDKHCLNQRWRLNILGF